jgi:hypothetical protein
VPKGCALGSRRRRTPLLRLVIASALVATASGCASAAPAGRTTTFAFNAPVPEAKDPSATPAVRYASLDRATCEAELGRRGIAYKRVDEARGVLMPLRLLGPLHGVSFHSALPALQRATSPFEIVDCRLVLALDDFAALVASHGVVEVVHMSMYRPPGRSWPAGKIGSRHDGALAIDAGHLVKQDGTVLDVEKDFHGRIGASTCGPGTGPSPATPAALELRDIVCDAADEHLFNVELTPDYNWPHRNHLHLEVTANVRWFLVH